MEISTKQKYEGQLGLRYDHRTAEFEYILTYHEYPKYMPEVVKLEDGDELVVRSPLDGSILMRRIVELDYESFRRMDHETGQFFQFVSGQRVKGVQTQVEPTYWFNLFAQGYFADLIKVV